MVCLVLQSLVHEVDIAMLGLRLHMPVQFAQLAQLRPTLQLFSPIASLVLQEVTVSKDPQYILEPAFAELVHTQIQERGSLRSAFHALMANIAFQTHLQLCWENALQDLMLQMDREYQLRA